MFAQLCGFSTSHEIIDDSFYKYYYDISQLHWARISNSALLLSKHELGPHVFKINDEEHCIIYQKVTPFNANNKTTHPNMSIQQIQSNLSSMIDRLHVLGYGHGDLHINNIGFIGDKLYILDHDTIYKIEDGQVNWLSLWMNEGFQWQDSFEDFIENDYDTWKSDWLDNINH